MLGHSADLMWNWTALLCCPGSQLPLEEPLTDAEINLMGIDRTTFFGWESLVDETDLMCSVSLKKLQMHVNTIAVVLASKLVKCQKMSKKSIDFQTCFDEASHVWIGGFGITMSFDCVH